MDPRHRTHERQRWEQKENGSERRGKGVRCWRQPPRGSASFPGAPCGPETMARKNGPVPPGRFTKLISLFQGQQRRQENGQTRIQTPGTRAYTLGPGRSRMAPLGRPTSSTRPTQDCLEGLRHICFGEYTFEEINLLHSLTA